MLGAALPTYLMVPAHAQIAIDVSVDVPPPPLPYYEQPPIPAERISGGHLLYHS